MYRLIISCAAVVLTLTPTTAPAIPKYLFDLVYQDPTAQSGWASGAGPTIADSEAVAFDVFVRKVIRVDDGVATTLFDDNVDPGLSGRNPVISGNGEFVVYGVNFNSGNADQIFRASRSAGNRVLIVEEGQNIPGFGTTDFLLCRDFCDVANDGSVTFGGSRSGSSTGKPFADRVLATGSGGALDVFASFLSPLYDTFSSFATNDVGFRIATTFVDQFGNEVSTVSVNTDNATNPPTPIFDSSAAFNTFQDAVISDNNDILFIAVTDLGVREVWLRRQSTGNNLIASSAGELDSFEDISVNNSGQVVFTARTDSNIAHEIILTGGDPVMDRVIGYGDVIDGKTVIGASIGRAQGINNSGQIAVGLSFADGTDGIYVVDSFGTFLADLKGQITTGTGGLGGLLANTGLPPGDFSLGFELEYLAGASALEVVLGGRTLGQFGPGSEGTLLFGDLDPADFGRPGETIELSFLLDGAAGTTVRLDDIMLVDLLSGLALPFRNGDFEEGLAGWQVVSRDGGTAFVSAVATSAVPVPAGLPLLLAALAVIAVSTRSRAHAGGASPARTAASARPPISAP